MPNLKIISAADVRELLPMDHCVQLMADAMRAASTGKVRVPARMMMKTSNDSGLMALMPGSSRDPDVYGAKIISIHEANRVRGLPSIQGFVALFDHNTGIPLAIIEGAQLTAIRTAAASGMATKFLSRRDATTHGIFGTGVQARTHVEAIAAVRPIDRVVVWGRDIEKARTFTGSESARTGLTMVATEDPEEAAACDIVSTVTTSAKPVLYSRWVRPGAHINLVGSHSPAAREADSDLIARARVFTDLLESLFNEAGDVLIPIAEKRIAKSDVAGEIGRVVSGEIEGRRDDAEITVYKSLGVTAQDLYAGYSVYAKAVESGAGTDVLMD